MTRNGGRRTLQDRRLAELPNSKLTAEARDLNQNTTFSTESAGLRQSARRMHRPKAASGISLPGNGQSSVRAPDPLLPFGPRPQTAAMGGRADSDLKARARPLFNHGTVRLDTNAGRSLPLPPSDRDLST
jgi:hypothetical protein